MIAQLFLHVLMQATVVFHLLPLCCTVAVEESSGVQALCSWNKVFFSQYLYFNCVFLFLFSLYLYTNICAFYFLHWENMLVPFLFKSVLKLQIVLKVIHLLFKGVVA